ncbi:hypothetical protein ACFFX0_30685 [Citricoccus parietis]|uniref:Uncharacterized protein n=1 Tax=Citricoccus parietis TaxID=592307 RepID=A0ABV5G8N4_9MICC
MDLVDELVVLFRRLRFRVDGVVAALEHLRQQAADVAHLDFHEEHEAAASRERVGPAQHEEVRELGDGHAQVCLGVVVLPHLPEPHSVNTPDIHRREEAGGLEPGGPNKDVRTVLLTGCRDHCIGADLHDGLIHQGHMILLESRVPSVVEEDPLAKRRIVGDSLLQQVLSAVELFGDVFGEVGTVTVVAGIHRPFGMLPLGIDAQCLDHLVTELPEQPQPVPGPIEGTGLKEQAQVVGDGLLELLEGGDPLR